MWIRCTGALRRGSGWAWTAARVGSHGVAWAALLLALAGLTLGQLQDPLAIELTSRAELTPRAGWVASGLVLLSLAGLVAAMVGTGAALLAAAFRASSRLGFAAVATLLVGLQVPWAPVASVGRTLAAGRTPRISQVEALLPAGRFASPLVGVGPVVWPVPRRARVTSGFGWRLHPVLGRTRFHNGVDIAVSEGTPVRAATDGLVYRAGEDPLNGRYVVILGPRGLRTAYCHLSVVHTRAGARVRAGDPIGASGQTGRATGPHLHFGAWMRGRAVDPRRLLVAG